MGLCLPCGDVKGQGVEKCSMGLYPSLIYISFSTHHVCMLTDESSCQLCRPSASHHRHAHIQVEPEKFLSDEKRHDVCYWGLYAKLVCQPSRIVVLQQFIFLCMIRRMNSNTAIQDIDYSGICLFWRHNLTNQSLSRYPLCLIRSVRKFSKILKKAQKADLRVKDRIFKTKDLAWRPSANVSDGLKEKIYTV